MSTGGMELKALWGTVNAAHSDFADVADAVAWSQEKGYHEVYLPPGIYNLDGLDYIDLYTDGFTLRGAGMEKTTLVHNGDSEYAIRLKPPDPNTALLKGVRLADFTVQRGSSTTAKGGVYLYHCFLCSLERVRSSGWYQAGEIEPHSYGFKANRGPASAGNEPPSGAILFSQCCVESSFHGIWLTGDSVARPLQRCHLFSVYLDGPVIVKGTASGGNVQNLIDVTKNFVAAEVRPGDWVFNETKGCYGKVNRILNYQQYLNARLELVNPWTGSTINGCDDGDVYSVVADLAYGVHIEKAYVSWYERYVRFHELRHPATMGAPEVEQFISHLASDGLVAASTQNPCTEPCPEPCPERSQRGSRRGGV